MGGDINTGAGAGCTDPAAAGEVAVAQFRFYEELNDFLPRDRRKTTFIHAFTRRASVKDMIESFGVPHTEVELIIVNGRSVDFSHIVTDQDHISVYPMFESLDIRPLLRLRPAPLRRPAFVLDTQLGRLARYLRLLGFDTLYRNDYSDDGIARLSSEQGRILLTRDRMLLQRSIITHGYFVRATDPLQQVDEVLQRFDLYNDIQPLTRCIRCNGRLTEVDKDIVIDRLEPKTKRYYNQFRICRDCDQVYWEGSHFRKMIGLIDGFREKARS
ncbi:MAG: Mut7-C ubiquitin/RNAse domain-containing protein [Gammaproteobacteria bacterium]|nr:Mut7-C ubiquitin/RNAse domain-containing protein [Gammaproteobacteria bacterium]MDH3559874.1 Mut7-C ubiquitin/RNAse domain-containing protein [Gammaproteobacteria bacterium]